MIYLTVAGRIIAGSTNDYLYLYKIKKQKGDKQIIVIKPENSFLLSII